jgi:hypothetical protein
MVQHTTFKVEGLPKPAALINPQPQHLAIDEALLAK